MVQTQFPPFPERTWRDALGGIVIESRVGAPPGRKGYERQFFPGVEVGLAGWERAHSQGNITGHESAAGIRYAPAEVNQEFQRLGIELFVRELFEEKAADVELRLTTVTYTHPGTLRLKEIQYRVDAIRHGVPRTLFEASIEVQNKRERPRVTPRATVRLPRELWTPYLVARPQQPRR
jgi:hypothetical protein